MSWHAEKHQDDTILFFFNLKFYISLVDRCLHYIRISPSQREMPVVRMHYITARRIHTFGTKECKNEAWRQNMIKAAAQRCEMVYNVH